jgi:hypothetical protein
MQRLNIGYGTNRPKKLIHLVQNNVAIRLQDFRLSSDASTNIEFINGNTDVFSASSNTDWRISNSNSIFSIQYGSNNIINNALKILSETREETILVFGNEESQTIENILKNIKSTNYADNVDYILIVAADYLKANIYSYMFNRKGKSIIEVFKYVDPSYTDNIAILHNGLSAEDAQAHYYYLRPR